MRIFHASLLLFLSLPVAAEEQAHAVVATCAETTLTVPGSGRLFKGVVKNEDYRFAAIIPNGHSAWDGVADSAPFHGFTIFLDPEGSACIDFKIGLRIDAESVPEGLKGKGSIRLGKANAWQWMATESIDGKPVTNMTTLLTHHFKNSVFDGEVRLISPKGQVKKYIAAYNSFVQSLRFY